MLVRIEDSSCTPIYPILPILARMLVRIEDSLLIIRRMLVVRLVGIFRFLVCYTHKSTKLVRVKRTLFVLNEVVKLECFAMLYIPSALA